MHISNCHVSHSSPIALLCLPEQDRLLLVLPEHDSLLLLEDIYAWINQTVERETEEQMLSQQLHRDSLAQSVGAKSTGRQGEIGGEGMLL